MSPRGPLRLYDYLPSGNCFKVRLLLDLLSLPYERLAVDIFAGETLTDDYAAINPARTTPVLEIAPGRYLPESNAILLYLAEGSQLLPDDDADRAQVYRWLLFEQSAIVPTIADLRFRLLTGRLDPDGDRARQMGRLAVGAVRVVEQHLEQRAFLIDKFTVADVCLYAYLHVADQATIDLNRLPKTAAWLERTKGELGDVSDLPPFPDNARPDRSQSIHDLR